MFECFQFSLVILSIIFYKRENFFKTFLIILSLEKVFILCKKSSHNPAQFWTALRMSVREGFTSAPEAVPGIDGL